MSISLKLFDLFLNDFVLSKSTWAFSTFLNKEDLTGAYDLKLGLDLLWASTWMLTEATRKIWKSCDECKLANLIFKDVIDVYSFLFIGFLNDLEDHKQKSFFFSIKVKHMLYGTLYKFYNKIAINHKSSCITEKKDDKMNNSYVTKFIVEKN
ncbi:hypothetical protein BpHYR1_005809 [Brachionus plicatilis]|uniref:Uncharacterized protein n=1 Tax=Brachionus plicatilis TaxID=10195 RepID=A0A3M7QDN2_BRAPC|nr:hypothetical protein BpHYR1_005809 [Brachionus plicatilis]